VSAHLKNIEVLTMQIFHQIGGNTTGNIALSCHSSFAKNYV